MEGKRLEYIPDIPINHTSENGEKELMDSQTSVGKFATPSDVKTQVFEISANEKEHENSQMPRKWFDAHPVENSQNCEVSVGAFISKDDEVEKSTVKTDIYNGCGSVRNHKEQFSNYYQKEHVNSPMSDKWFDAHPVENSYDCEVSVGAFISKGDAVQKPAMKTVVCNSVCNLKQQFSSHHQKEYLNSLGLFRRFDSRSFENSQECEVSVDKFISKDEVQNSVVKSDISNMCGSVCNLKQQSSNNFQEYSNDQDCACKENGKECSDERGLQCHLFNHTSEKLLICNFCGKAYTQINSFKTHLCLQADRFSFVCEVCGKTLAKKSMLRHLRTHTNEKPYTCEVCGRAFADKKTSKVHLRTHTKKKTEVCQLSNCLQEYSNGQNYEFKKHRRGFSNESGLQQHSYNDTEEKPLICNVCGIAYTQSNSLKTHFCLQANKNSYICEVCGKNLAKKSKMRHLRTHTKEKPYTCEVCGRTFADVKTLKQHLCTHTKEKPFVCGVCSRAFTQLSNLKRHLGTHMVEKPYICKFCGESFIRKVFFQQTNNHTCKRNSECLKGLW